MAHMELTPLGFAVLVVLPLVLCWEGIIGLSDLAAAAERAAGFAWYCAQDITKAMLAAQALFWGSRLANRIRREVKLSRRRVRDLCETCLILAFVSCVLVGLRSGLLGDKVRSAGAGLWSLCSKTQGWSAALPAELGDWMRPMLQCAGLKAAPPSPKEGCAGAKGGSTGVFSATECHYDVVWVT